MVTKQDLIDDIKDLQRIMNDKSTYKKNLAPDEYFIYRNGEVYRVWDTIEGHERRIKLLETQKEVLGTCALIGCAVSVALLLVLFWKGIL